jgi:uncharacterized flavoprotein (TIGR03862 family)
MNAPAPASAIVPVSSKVEVLIIGAGPAGLMAAEVLATKGFSVQVHEKMPSVARKFLMAGRGGLNLTHTEPRPGFDARYGAAADRIGAWLDGYDASQLMAWAEGLGQPLFVGSSRRVFPKAMKASPLLRAWLVRLEGLGVQIVTRSEWVGQRDDSWLFRSPSGETAIKADAVLLALGGASWPKLGSDAAWVPWLAEKGVAIEALRPANAGFNLDWSEVMKSRFAGVPLKNVAVTHADRTVRGEVMIAAYGIEGGAIYALSADLRRAIEVDGKAELRIDLRPDQSFETLARKLSAPRGKNSLSNHLRKAVGLDAAAVALLREAGHLSDEPEALAARIKAVLLTLDAMQGLERAISSAGGIRLDQLDDDLMLTALPGVFACGEMLDWEAPTGGYLLQACFASGVRAADGISRWLAKM